MRKISEIARKSFKQLCQQRFACAKDAQSAIIKWQGKQAVCEIDANFVAIAVYKGAGRLSVSNTR